MDETIIEYAKIVVLLRDNNVSINKLELDNCYQQISGNFLILSTFDKNNNKICNILNLTDVKSYKLYKKEN